MELQFWAGALVFVQTWEKAGPEKQNGRMIQRKMFMQVFIVLEL